ncbi:MULTISPECIES: response regulator [unclassified Paenibacillus]|uniref:response regulator n=1 Tax=unclassified Paenibacillus TaxID=185978 RepID=UPI002406CA0C|nr:MULTISPECIES: response regulator [unclassified Paenibacillus]MDF9845308.1 two-component system LytT family response regulator [Paenibacillus sp. PastF-2]MDF9851890.1 two-component system LytT family response regulator [Paenibacillus sp. PastM-2]MDF9858454.1 two-component system LytT family response regulator [Paenibacillus sp. PastF-1]MDH6483721.1 two-component system LytT family response regulator [Paenibacillus sp. PastH-2]MDH6511103.1 two-component system LytT family response regulator [
MKVVIIDDEKAMHLILKRMLAKVAEVEVVGTFADTAAAYAYITANEVDLILADISMPRENGLEFARRLRESGKDTKLVYITSHKDHALSAFEVYAFDYIVKPVVQERLTQTVQRAMAQVRLERATQSTLEEPGSEVQVNCLGGMEMQSAAGLKTKWKSKKSAEVFAYLLTHKGRLVSRSRLIGDIFDGMPQKNAEVYLNTTIYQLRKLLDTFGLKKNLHSDSQHYGLSLSGVRVDMLIFEEGCRAMTVINETNVKAAIELEQLYRGDLFGDLGFAWAWHEIERLSQMYTAFTRRLCAALLEQEDVGAATRLLLKLLSRNELDEESLMLLLTASARLKNKEAMNRQYSQFAETLRAEIGVSPSLEVKSLYAQLLAELAAAGY